MADGQAERTVPSVTRAEWAWLAAAAAGITALTSVPYLVGVLSQAPGWHFGGFLIGVEDGNSYLAKMGQGARGAWLFTLPYSSEPQRGTLIYLFYLLLGKVAGPSPEAQILTYHLARILLGAALLAVSYWFLAHFLPEPRQRRTGLALVALGGGLGWLLTLVGQTHALGSLPIDLISPEAYSFLVLFSLPHLAAARCALLLGLLAYLRGRGALAGVALLALGLIQPLYVVVAWAVVGAHVLLNMLSLRGVPPRARWRAAGLVPALALGVLSAPPVIYTILLFSTDAIIRQWGIQNALPSPHPAHYLLGFGLLLLPAWFGWRDLSRRRPDLARFAGGWVVMALALLYAPVSVQRRLVEGVQLPLVALGVLGLDALARARGRWLRAPYFAVSLLTSAMLLAGGVGAARAPAEPIFHPAEQLAAFAWLRDHARPGQVVLSSFETGNVLPAFAPLVAYIGHGPETVFLAQKKPRVARFFQAGTSHDERLGLLRDGRIDFLIIGPHERALGDFSPDEADYLAWEMSARDYAVYSVRR